MKLYHHAGACSLADYIALEEAGLAFDVVDVDLKAKTTSDGSDYRTVNPKGYVPALTLDDGETITENIAILDWIAHSAPKLVPQVKLARTRLIETLAYISTELHKNFKPFFANAADDQKKAAAETITRRLQLLADHLDGDYLFGDTVSAADPYLFVMLTWCENFGITIPDPLPAFAARMRERASVKAALAHDYKQAT